MKIYYEHSSGYIWCNIEQKLEDGTIVLASHYSNINEEEALKNALIRLVEKLCMIYNNDKRLS